MRSDSIAPVSIAVALMVSSAVANAQDIGGAVAFDNVTSPICRRSCDSLATVRRDEDAVLRAAIAAVPVARRPLAFIKETLNITVGGTLPTTVTTVWALFPNGHATDCYGWDPRQTVPSPTSLRGHADDCSVGSWRRTGGGIVLTYADGEESEPYAVAEIRRFTPGQRVAQQMRSYGPSVTAPGFVRVDISDMTLTSEGTVRFLNRNRVWQGGGSTDRTRTDDARYYFDGYLAAVRFPNGRIDIFITGHEGSKGNARDLRYIHWNGALFGAEGTAPK